MAGVTRMVFRYLCVPEIFEEARFAIMGSWRVPGCSRTCKPCCPTCNDEEDRPKSDQNENPSAGFLVLLPAMVGSSLYAADLFFQVNGSAFFGGQFHKGPS